MRQLRRDRRRVWASLYESREQVADADGRLTGEWRISRRAIEIHPTVSPASGALDSYGFGVGADYDRTLVLAGTDTGIDEHTVFWVDVEPRLADDGTLATNEDGSYVTPWDYVAARPPAVSANYTNIAIRRADR